MSKPIWIDGFDRLELLKGGHWGSESLFLRGRIEIVDLYCRCGEDVLDPGLWRI